VIDLQEEFGEEIVCYWFTSRTVQMLFILMIY